MTITLPTPNDPVKQVGTIASDCCGSASVRAASPAPVRPAHCRPTRKVDPNQSPVGRRAPPRPSRGSVPSATWLRPDQPTPDRVRPAVALHDGRPP